MTVCKLIYKLGGCEKRGVFGQRRGKWEFLERGGEKMLIFPVFSWFLGSKYGDRILSKMSWKPVEYFYGRVDLIDFKMKGRACHFSEII